MHGRPGRLGWTLSVALCLLTACGSSGSSPSPSATLTGGDSRELPPGIGSEVPGVGPAAHASVPAPDRTVEADVRFMQDMILHHAQAIEMAALVPDRSERDEIRLLARRIEVSQLGEIRRMQQWLERRDEPVPAVVPVGPHPAHHAAPVEPGDHSGRVDMPGMLTPEQMTRLAAASGEEFDRLFLELMVLHHEGAVRMVEELFSSPGGGQDSDVFALASHVHAEQRMEIARMQQWLGVSEPPFDH